MSDFTVYNRTKRMGARLIIIRYWCCKQCELLFNKFLIKGLRHKLIGNLLCHLPLSSIIDDKISTPPPLLSTPHSVADPGFWIRGVKFKKFRPKSPIFRNITVGLHFTWNDWNQLIWKSKFVKVGLRLWEHCQWVH